MIPCQECIQRCYPSDPRLDDGCLYWCDKPEYYRQLETQPVPERVVIHRHSDMSKQDWDLLQQTARRVEYLEKKLLTQTPQQKRPARQRVTYKGIK